MGRARRRSPAAASRPPGDWLPLQSTSPGSGAASPVPRPRHYLDLRLHCCEVSRSTPSRLKSTSQDQRLHHRYVLKPQVFTSTFVNKNTLVYVHIAAPNATTPRPSFKLKDFVKPMENANAFQNVHTSKQVHDAVFIPHTREGNAFADIEAGPSEFPWLHQCGKLQ